MSSPVRFVMGALFIAMRLFALLAALDVPPFDQGKNAPDWVVGLAGTLFALGGIFIWLQGTGWEKSAGALLGILMSAGLAAIANWVAFGPGERGCTGSLSFAFGFTSHDAGEWECRGAFGIGAVMLDAFVLLAVASQLKTWCGPHKLFALLEKFAWGVLLLALSPLLLLLVVFAVISGGKDALLEKARAWLARRREPGGKEPGQR